MCCSGIYENLKSVRKWKDVDERMSEKGRELSRGKEVVFWGYLGKKTREQLSAAKITGQ